MRHPHVEGSGASQKLRLLAAAASLVLLLGPGIGWAAGNVVARAEFQLPLQAQWFDSGVAASQATSLAISASGRGYIGAISLGQPDISDYQSPEGDAQTTTGIQGRRIPYLASGLTPWSLVGKIGPSGKPFEIGAGKTIVPSTSGELYLSVNDNNFRDNSGSWEVSITGRLNADRLTEVSGIEGSPTRSDLCEALAERLIKRGVQIALSNNIIRVRVNNQWIEIENPAAAAQLALYGFAGGVMMGCAGASH
ncbi:MAG TPA: hypothetical protein VMH86_03545 [Rhizomicrobium sp.]|nr:hypothetical protein [Rhizomicrobium sp.]